MFLLDKLDNEFKMASFELVAFGQDRAYLYYSIWSLHEIFRCEFAAEIKQHHQCIEAFWVFKNMNRPGLGIIIDLIVGFKILIISIFDSVTFNQIVILFPQFLFAFLNAWFVEIDIILIKKMAHYITLINVFEIWIFKVSFFNFEMLNWLNY